MKAQLPNKDRKKFILPSYFITWWFFPSSCLHHYAKLEWPSFFRGGKAKNLLPQACLALCIFIGKTICGYLCKCILEVPTVEPNLEIPSPEGVFMQVELLYTEVALIVNLHVIWMQSVGIFTKLVGKAVEAFHFHLIKGICQTKYSIFQPGSSVDLVAFTRMQMVHFFKAISLSSSKPFFLRPSFNLLHFLNPQKAFTLFFHKLSTFTIA